MPKEKRQWQEREMRMLAEWLEKTYSGQHYFTRVRLGRPPEVLEGMVQDEAERRMLKVWQRWADAVVVLPDRVIIIEAAIRSDPGDISKLELYKALLPYTAEFTAYKHLPIELVLLYALEDAVLVKLARERDIKTIYYRPPWLSDYLDILYPRERRSPIAGQELL